MLIKKELDSRKKLEFTCLEQLVPKEHLLRKIDKIIDFNFIYDDTLLSEDRVLIPFY